MLLRTGSLWNAWLEMRVVGLLTPCGGIDGGVYAIPVQYLPQRDSLPDKFEPII